MNIIEVKNLTKKYDDFTAVDGITFSVERGETFGILGPNGAGKTTTLEMIEGLKGIYVKSFEFETEGQYLAADLEPIRAQLRGAGWTRLVNVVSKKEGNVEVYLQFAGEMVNGLAVLHTDDKELTVVNIVGPVDLDKLAQLEGQMGIPDLGIESPKSKKKTNEQ